MIEISERDRAQRQPERHGHRQLADAPQHRDAPPRRPPTARAIDSGRAEQLVGADEHPDGVAAPTTMTAAGGGAVNRSAPATAAAATIVAAIGFTAPFGNQTSTPTTRVAPNSVQMT